jgi:uncharacterized protein (TIGR03382 family)
MTFGLTRKLAGATLVALSVLSSLAQAAITTHYSAVTTGADPGSFTSGTLGASFADTQQVGGIALVIGSSGTQSASLGTLSTTTITISNMGTGLDSIKISLAAQGYTLPNPSLFLTSAASGTSANFISGQTALLQSYADSANGGLGTVFAATTSGPQAGSVVGIPPNSTPYTFIPPTAVALFVSTGSYSIGQMLTVNLAAGKSATLTLVSNVQVTLSSVPEPATAAMALSGLPVLGVLWARRRKQS